MIIRQIHVDDDRSSSNPFTIAIILNPFLYSPGGSPTLVRDPLQGHLPDFYDAARYIVDCLYGRLPAQAEKLLDDWRLRGKIRVDSYVDCGAGQSDANALVALDDMGDLLIPRRQHVLNWLTRNRIFADVAYVVSGSTTHGRAAAYMATDDEGQGGTPFHYDGTSYMHCYYSSVPGTIAIHSTSRSLTALHEFSHAVSSYSNGMIIDLYINGTNKSGINKKHGRPIPVDFCDYNGMVHRSDLGRGPLGYGTGWTSYHCELFDASSPALMDDYWREPHGVPERCQHDKISRQFLLDRLIAKIGR